MAEVLKHGAITSGAHFDGAARFAAQVHRATTVGASVDWRAGEAVEAIARSMSVKADIVRRDERESGLRQILNAGHTVAHAIELVSDYRCLHGEAVAIGLVAETRIAARVGVADANAAGRIAAALAAAGLPTRIPAGITSQALVTAMQTDKKVRAGRLSFAFLADVGEPAGSDERGWTTQLDAASVAATLDELIAR
jgi:3-dehydroquinate synthase